MSTILPVLLLFLLFYAAQRIDAAERGRRVSCHWSRTRPTRAGWYWVRHPELSPRLTQYRPVYPGSILMGDHDWSDHLRKHPNKYEYAGPIELPTP